jgi:YggT family protein
MSPGIQALAFLIQVIMGLVVFVFILRFLMRATRVDWRLPIVHIVARLTNWACAPLGKLIPVKGRWDWAALVAALLAEAIYIAIIGALTGRSFGLATMGIFAVAETLNVLLDTLFWLVIIQVILSWIQPGYNPNLAIFSQMAEPILRPFQRFIPPIAGLDLSPIAAIVAIKMTQILFIGPIAGIAQGMIISAGG